jgi:hypothetical protein
VTMYLRNQYELCKVTSRITASCSSKVLYHGVSLLRSHLVTHSVSQSLSHSAGYTHTDSAGLYATQPLCELRLSWHLLSCLSASHSPDLMPSSPRKHVHIRDTAMTVPSVCDMQPVVQKLRYVLFLQLDCF